MSFTVWKRDLPIKKELEGEKREFQLNSRGVASSLCYPDLGHNSHENITGNTCQMPFQRQLGYPTAFPHLVFLRDPLSIREGHLLQ